MFDKSVTNTSVGGVYFLPGYLVYLNNKDSVLGLKSVREPALLFLIPLIVLSSFAKYSSLISPSHSMF